MIPKPSKKMNVETVEKKMIELMMSTLKEIYSNKSSDEYKSHGDITKSSEYATIQKSVADTKTLRGFPSRDAKDLAQLFQTLHRPVFKTMVTEYINEPDERNTLFTAFYTVGFRILVGELGRIFASTIATDKGIVYKPDKISKKESLNVLIRSFNDSLENKINDYVKHLPKSTSPVQEGAVADIAKLFGNTGLFIFNNIYDFFHQFSGNNPISLMNAFLMHSYDKKVTKLYDTKAMYNEAKAAYAEYLKIPDNERNKKVESNYVKIIDKYNIKMQNQLAKLKHYNKRAEDEVAAATRANSSTNQTSSSSDNEDDSTTNTSPVNDNDDGIDF